MDFLISISLIPHIHAKICQHVNRGCIDIGDTPACESKNSVVVVGSGSATFYARFSGSNQGQNTWSGCVLKAHWPAYYGDIYFGADNCLYDSTGKYLHFFLRK